MFLPDGSRLIGNIYAGKYRTQYAKELQMIKIFKTQPDMTLLNKLVNPRWNQVGPF
jgi:hypothetical protein